MNEAGAALSLERACRTLLIECVVSRRLVSMPKDHSLVVDPREHRLSGKVKIVASSDGKLTVGKRAANARTALIKRNAEFKSQRVRNR